MPETSPTVLIIPGYTNSGPEHWQSLWQVAHPEYHRVEQEDWDAPDVAKWVAALEREVRSAKTQVIFVAHSLGCITVAHWAERHPESTNRVAAAMLVAPADIERVNAPQVLRSFGPIPRMTLPFPSVVVASTTDSYASIARAQAFATAWQSQFVDIGDAGHINTAAGFGPWTAGEEILARVQQSDYPV